MCPRCGGFLNDSCYVNDDNYKSCPRCSVRLGVHAYYSCDHFGMRHDIIQSWCPACRSGRDDAQPEFLCQ